MREPPPPPRPDLLPRPGPIRPSRTITPWLIAGVALVGLALIAFTGAQVIDRRTAETPSATSAPSPSAAPNASRTPGQAPPFATLEVRRAGKLGTPDGWFRWRASDGSFSFGYPRGVEPRDPTFEGGVWELDSRGNAVHLYIYVTDLYPIGTTPMSSFNEIADILTVGQTDLHRSRVVRHGLTGLDLEYLDIDADYRFFVRLYAHRGLLYQVTAGYWELLHGRELGVQATTFLDSFRIHDGAVTGAS